MMDHNEWPGGRRAGGGGLTVAARTLAGIVAVLLLVGGLQASDPQDHTVLIGACYPRPHLFFYSIHIIPNLFSLHWSMVGVVVSGDHTGAIQ